MEKIIPHSPTPAGLRCLLEQNEGLRLSLYLPLPEHRGFDDVRLFPASYELAVKAAVARLSELGASQEQVDLTQKQLKQVKVGIASLPAATHALAVFGGTGMVTAFALAQPTATALHVGRSFRVRPILQAAQLEFGYRVLAVSSNQVSLFEGDVHGLRAIPANGVPGSLEEALGTQLSSGTSQYHSGGGEGVIHHGQGGAREGRTVDQDRFHHLLTRSVTEFWNGREDPLVLATDPSNDGALRKLARLPGMLEQTAVGNPDRLSLQELHIRTWPIAQAWVNQQQSFIAQETGTSQVLMEIESVVQAAVSGRVARLWLDAEQQFPGHLNPENGELDAGLGDEDVLDELAVLVASKGGEVLLCASEDLPNPSQLRAELRG